VYSSQHSWHSIWQLWLHLRQLSHTTQIYVNSGWFSPASAAPLVQPSPITTTIEQSCCHVWRHPCRHVPQLCLHFLTSLCGQNPSGNVEPGLIPTIFQHLPAGTSVQGMSHWAQGIRRRDSRLLHAFDYGTDCSTSSTSTSSSSRCNQVVYGQRAPPSYDVANVTVPLALFSGEFLGAAWCEWLLACEPTANKPALHTTPAVCARGVDFALDTHMRVGCGVCHSLTWYPCTPHGMQCCNCHRYARVPVHAWILTPSRICLQVARTRYLRYLMLSC
jgi:hypothetical protein